MPRERAWLSSASTSMCTSSVIRRFRHHRRLAVRALRPRRVDPTHDPPGTQPPAAGRLLSASSTTAQDRARRAMPAGPPPPSAAPPSSPASGFFRLLPASSPLRPLPASSDSTSRTPSHLLPLGREVDHQRVLRAAIRRILPVHLKVQIAV